MKPFEVFAAAAASLGVLLASSAASADTISHFTVKGALTDKAKLTGAIYVDIDTGRITSGAIGVGAPDNFNEINIAGQGENYFGQGYYGVGLRNAAATEDLNINFDKFNLVDYKGGGFRQGNLFNLVSWTSGSQIASLKFAADSVKKFYASGSLNDGAPIGGYLTINRTLGTIVRSNLKLGGPDYLSQVAIQHQEPDGFGSVGHYGAGIRNATSTEDFNFLFPINSLVNYGGGSILQGNLFNLTTNTGGAAVSAMSLSMTVPPAGTFAVPEPATWTMMLLGLGGLGAALRSRRRTAITA